MLQGVATRQTAEDSANPRKEPKDSVCELNICYRERIGTCKDVSLAKSDRAIPSGTVSILSQRKPRLRLFPQVEVRQPGIIDCLLDSGYTLGGSLAAGSSATSLRIVECEGGDRRLLKAAYTDEQVAQLAKEYHLLKRSGFHDSITRVFEWHTTVTGSGFVMALSRGVTLHKFYKEISFHPAAVAAHSLAAQLTSAVAHLHALHIVHRDLHSQNVMVEGECASKACKAVLIDFGSATMRPPSGLPRPKPPDHGAYDVAEVPEHQVDWAIGSWSVGRWEPDLGGKQKRSGSPRTSSAHSQDPIPGLQLQGGCASFADEWTMPAIMPPEQCVFDAGDAYQVEAFAVGLLIAGLARWRNTETRDVYTKSAKVRGSWQRPAPPLTPDLEELVRALIHLNPVERCDVAQAERLLPSPELWYRNETRVVLS